MSPWGWVWGRGIAPRAGHCSFRISLRHTSCLRVRRTVRQQGQGLASGVAVCRLDDGPRDDLGEIAGCHEKAAARAWRNCGSPGRGRAGSGRDRAKRTERRRCASRRCSFFRCVKSIMRSSGEGNRAMKPSILCCGCPRWCGFRVSPRPDVAPSGRGVFDQAAVRSSSGASPVGAGRGSIVDRSACMSAASMRW